MPIINFSKEFADDVKRGKKRQTIRKLRKRPFKVGDKLYLYTGLRTKKTRKLGEKLANEVFFIQFKSQSRWRAANTKRELLWASRYLGYQERASIAEKDGFTCFNSGSPSPLALYHWFLKTHAKGDPKKLAKMIFQVVRWLE